MKFTAFTALLAAFAIATPAAAQTLELPEEDPTFTDDAPISADTVIEIDEMSDAESTVFGCTFTSTGWLTRLKTCECSFQNLSGDDCVGEIIYSQRWLLFGGWDTTFWSYGSSSCE